MPHTAEIIQATSSVGQFPLLHPISEHPSTSRYSSGINDHVTVAMDTDDEDDVGNGGSISWNQVGGSFVVVHQDAEEGVSSLAELHGPHGSVGTLVQKQNTVEPTSERILTLTSASSDSGLPKAYGGTSLNGEQELSVYLVDKSQYSQMVGSEYTHQLSTNEKEKDDKVKIEKVARVNSAQRRREFANSVRRARIQTNTEAGNSSTSSQSCSSYYSQVTHDTEPMCDKPGRSSGRASREDCRPRTFDHHDFDRNRSMPCTCSRCSDDSDGLQRALEGHHSNRSSDRASKRRRHHHRRRHGSHREETASCCSNNDRNHHCHHCHHRHRHQRHQRHQVHLGRDSWSASVDIPDTKCRGHSRSSSRSSSRCSTRSDKTSYRKPGRLDELQWSSHDHLNHWHHHSDRHHGDRHHSDRHHSDRHHRDKHRSHAKLKQSRSDSSGYVSGSRQRRSHGSYHGHGSYRRQNTFPTSLKLDEKEFRSQNGSRQSSKRLKHRRTASDGSNTRVNHSRSRSEIKPTPPVSTPSETRKPFPTECDSPDEPGKYFNPNMDYLKVPSDDVYQFSDSGVGNLSSSGRSYDMKFIEDNLEHVVSGVQDDGEASLATPSRSTPLCGAGSYPEGLPYEQPEGKVPSEGTITGPVEGSSRETSSESILGGRCFSQPLSLQTGKTPSYDSAYQSNEQSTDKNNSKPNSNVVSPTIFSSQRHRDDICPTNYKVLPRR